AGDAGATVLRRADLRRARRARRGADVRAARRGRQRARHRLRLRQALVRRRGRPPARFDQGEGVPLHALLLHVVVAGVRSEDVGLVLRLDRGELPLRRMPRVAIVGPVFPYRAGIAHGTTLPDDVPEAATVSSARHYPRRWYP